MKKFLLSMVRFYRRWISPALPGACRFAPSCSAYAIEAIEKHGSVKGSILSASRLARCHPFNPGGWDPVPPIARSVSECGSDGVAGSSLCECADNQLADSTQNKYVRGSKVSGSVFHPDTPTPRYPDTLRG